MSAVKYLVPYEIAIHANDTKSGKPITNILYVKTGSALGAPPAYGAAIPGASDTSQLLSNVRQAWVDYFLPSVSEHYLTTDYVMRSIVGKRYRSPVLPITSVIPGAPVSVGLGTAHGLTTGDMVRISGVTAPTALNTDWGVVVTGPYTFQLAGSSVATPWSGDGNAQPLVGASGWEYGDLEVLTIADPGLEVGEACPLINTFSVRRISQAAGRHFRSRLSVGPVAESAQLNGKLTAGANTQWATNLAALVATPAIVNGGSEVPGSGQSFFGMVSLSLGLQQTSPFTSSSAFFSFTVNYQVRPNCGSMLRRKPKLTAGIAS